MYRTRIGPRGMPPLASQANTSPMPQCKRPYDAIQTAISQTCQQDMKRANFTDWVYVRNVKQAAADVHRARKEVLRSLRLPPDQHSTPPLR